MCRKYGMSFKKFIELNLPHVNDIGFQFADKLKLIRGGTTAMNQSKSNCYEVAANLASHFGFEPASIHEVRNLRDRVKKYFFDKKNNENLKPPVLPRPGLANFIVRDYEDSFADHVTFEYRGKEYNYSGGESRILFRIPLKKVVKTESISFIEFKNKIQEQIATKSFVGNNIINNNNDNNEGDDDEENWHWDNLKKYDNNLINWASNDPFAKRIKNAIIELVFKNEPSMDIPEILGDEENETEFASSGEVLLKIEWKMPVESIEDRLLETLRKSTVWKPLEIQPNELWNTLDKGDVFEYIYYHLKMSIIGHNSNIYDQHHHPERPNWQRLDQEYFTKQKDWQKDKQTLEKYARFMIYQQNEKLERFVQNYFPFDVSLQKLRENVRALVWEENFDTSANIWYRYSKD